MRKRNKMSVGDRFYLLGQPKPVFVVKNTYLAAGFIPSVHGETEDDRFQTNAREADVVRVVAPLSSPAYD